VTQATPTITWPNPSAINYGTPLSSAQLKAFATDINAASLSGTYAYTPASGTILDAGANQTLSVTFSPDDSTDYTAATESVSINVDTAPQTISFSYRPPITYGSTTMVTPGDGRSFRELCDLVATDLPRSADRR
jgi:hypothetical protein